VLAAIADYNAQLRERGIHLVLVLVPMKSTIYPEKVAMDYRAADGPAYGPGYIDWLKSVRLAGIDVLDLTATMWDAKGPASDPLYSPADIHWSPRGTELAADTVATYLRPLTRTLPRADFSVRPLAIDREGDLADWLSFGWGTNKFPRIQYTAPQLIKDGRPYIPGNEAPVLLLGDSFSASGPDQGYGFSAELMRRLDVAIQTFASRGDPMVRPRQEVLDDPGCLDKKRLVIWEVSQAGLWRPWNKMPLPDPVNAIPRGPIPTSYPASPARSGSSRPDGSRN
jgi:alginate O-acetyltransferase complex protein AlgJ